VIVAEWKSGSLLQREFSSISARHGSMMRCLMQTRTGDFRRILGEAKNHVTTSFSPRANVAFFVSRLFGHSEIDPFRAVPFSGNSEFGLESGQRIRSNPQLIRTLLMEFCESWPKKRTQPFLSHRPL
jgi:hypothetical protein